MCLLLQVILNWMHKHPRLAAAAEQHQHVQRSCSDSDMSANGDDASSKAQQQILNPNGLPTVEHCSIEKIAAAHPDGWHVLEAQVNEVPLVMGPEGMSLFSVRGAKMNV